MVISKRKVLDITAGEYKVPAILNLQVWDSDRIAPNDFIGTLSLELCCMPRGARSWRRCMMQKQLGLENTIDLFSVRRTRGWWSFSNFKSSKAVTTGYVEAELYLLTEEEAKLMPAGLGRKEPNALPKPYRPEYKFRVWMAPLYLLNHVLCKTHRKKALTCLFFTAMCLFFFIALYSVPVFIIKRIIGAK
uniref:Ferlin C-terminal domain-containing protein n=2 Tax=Clastoptera arizonana TaxID=38151 RepID=A0A1B6CJN5_9HEMI